MDTYFTTAITRKPGNNFAHGLTISNLGPPDYELILKQHDAYIDTLIVTDDFAHIEQIRGYDKIVVEADEAYAANTLWVNDRLLVPNGFPDTCNKLTALGLEIIELDMSEVRKMDGGLTCLSLRF
jgi:dimethylargininase